VRFSTRLALLIAGVVLVASLVAPLVAWGLAATLGTVHRFSFPRVYDRVLEILAVVALLAGRRWLGLGSWAALGLGRPERRRDLWLGLGLGLAALAAVVAVMYWADALRFFWRYPPAKAVRKALAGGVGAVLIGSGEEILFRGILLGGLGREMGRGAAVAWTTAIYAVVHFLRGGRQVGEVTLTSGFERVASAFAPLADPAIAPALCGFVLLGLLLAHARLRSGALYLPIGLHVGLVLGARVGRVVMNFPRRPGLLWGQARPPIVSGVAGWLGLLAAFVAVELVLRRRDAPRHGGSPGAAAA
jgi:membrane protease YdiL (CAAX protease family)